MVWLLKPSSKKKVELNGCGKCHSLCCITTFKEEHSDKPLCANCIDKMLSTGNYSIDDELKIIKVYHWEEGNDEKNCIGGGPT